MRACAASAAALCSWKSTCLPYVDDRLGAPLAQRKTALHVALATETGEPGAIQRHCLIKRTVSVRLIKQAPLLSARGMAQQWCSREAAADRV